MATYSQFCCSFLYSFSVKRICWWYFSFHFRVWADVCWNCQLHNLIEKHQVDTGLLGGGVSPSHWPWSGSPWTLVALA